MKKLLFSAIALLLGKAVLAQTPTLAELNKQRGQTSKTGMLILGGWSAANIVYGSIAASRTGGSSKYFHQMNVFWNVVNLGLATAGYLGGSNEAGLSYAESLKKQSTVEKLFLLNAGLDVAYMAGGLYLREKSKTNLKNPDRLKGYGESIILQGGALLVFDAVMYAVTAHHGAALYKLAGKMQVAATDSGLGLVYRL